MPTKLLYSLAEISHYWATYHLYYKKKQEMIKFTNNFLLVRPTSKLLLLPSSWSNIVVKFGTYYLHYNNKFTANLTQTFGFYFLYNFGNLSTISPILTSNGRAYNTKLGLVTKMREPPRIFQYLLLGAL